MPSNSIITGRRRGVASLVTVLLVASFAIVLVGAGHGVGPVGLLLVSGSFSAWSFPITLAWGGVLLTLAALLCSRTSLHVAFAAAGLA